MSLTRHWLLTLAIMCVSLIFFGLASYNIFFFLNANVNLIAEHGAEALMEGGLNQLGMLLVHGFLAVISYLVFKACEKILVEKMVK